MASSRGKSFTPEQDEAICRAYLCITEDPIIGNSQPRSQFWQRVLQQYQEKTNDVQRTEASIKARWQNIQKCCNKFRGCLRSIEALNQSGMTHQNEYDMAKQTYYEDTGKYFSGMDGCWAILEHAIKWQDITPSGRKVKTPEPPQIPEGMSFPFSPEASQIPSTYYESLDAETTPSSGGTGSVSSPRKRPGGKKLAKEKKAKSKVQEVENARHINLLETLNKTVSDNQSRRIQLEERRVASLERQTICEERETARKEKETERKDREMEERIMQMDLSVIQDPQMKAYYEHRKAAILAKWANSTSTTYYTDLPDY
ncbi:hypothetical protein Vadar_015836 [Vaccinium darrowii]|uniref:Uncharacterized protein n=1 Tax=Vaccinium darrowii TaxID=229202 RepID=A0ACB7YW64_9ERIC|nr:hypothetical protein Vadar_015836 [Vaccinium darrowii]